MSAVEDIKKYGSLNERYGAMEDRLKVTRASKAICWASLRPQSMIGPAWDCR